MNTTTIQKKLIKTSMQVSLPAFGIITLLVIALNVYLNAKTQSNIVKRIESSLIAKGKLLTANNAQSLVGMAEGNAFGQITDLVASTVKDDPDVVFGMFIIADTSMPCMLADESDSTKASGVLVKASLSNETLVTWVRAQKALNRVQSGTSIAFAAPVGSAEMPLGWILYKLSTSAMEEAIESEKASSRLALMLVVIILASLGISATVISLRRFKQAASNLSKPIHELAAAAEIIKRGNYVEPVVVESDDEIGELASTFDNMRKTIRTYTEHLEDLVDAKVRQVRAILDNVEQGLFVVDFDGSINPEYSKATTDILGLTSISTINEALRIHPAQEDDFRTWLDLVLTKHGSMRWEKLVRLAPIQTVELKDTSGDSRHISIKYQRVFDKNKNIEKIMVLAQDETEARRIERIVAEEKSRHENEVKTILGLVNNLPEAIKDFQKDTKTRLDDMYALVESMHQRATYTRENHTTSSSYVPAKEDISKIFRNLHTIKGNAGTYGFEILAKLAHKGEDILEQLQEPITIRCVDSLQELLNTLGLMDRAYSAILDTEKRLSGMSGDGDAIVQVSERKLRHVQKLARVVNVGGHTLTNSEAIHTLTKACRRLRDVPLSRVSTKYKNLVLRLAERLGKSVEFTTAPHNLELNPHFFAPIEEALVHMLRNSVDHGIESASARLSANKSERGNIKLSVSIDEDCVIVKLSDDGQGIDVDAVVEKAIAAGLVSRDSAVAMSEDSKLGLIFKSGISTASAISDISGRGVGMAAVKECIEALQGNITISSIRGQGSTTTIVLPNSFDS